MFDFKRIGITVAVLLASSTAFARPAELLRDQLLPKLERALASGKKVVVEGVPLGRESLDRIEIEPMQVWAPDARITVYDGPQPRQIAPPDVKYFKGRVLGEAESTVFLSMSKGKTQGLIIIGERRFVIGTTRRLPVGRREGPLSRDIDGPVAVAEIDAIDEIGDPSASWTCDVDKFSGLNKHLVIPETKKNGSLKQTGNAGDVAGATYQLKIAIETDNELCAAFGNDAPTITTYIGNLVGAASTIYQRDIATTLVVGDTQIRNGGPGTDPFTATVGEGTSKGLAEFGTYWHNNFAGLNRSSAVMLSGKGYSGGVAWSGTLCGGDFFCGAGGEFCGDPIFAGAYAGAYAFNGSLSGAITTTVPDPNLTINGVLYGIPNDNNFWMLLEFVHELGHNANGPHTHCVALDAAEQILYGVPGRTFVDLCYDLEGGCYSGTTSAPSEKGTVMSYCHNIVVGGFRASRYLMGSTAPNEPSAKVLPFFKTELEADTPNGTITTQAEPIACSAGRTASVAACAGCTITWGITGGAINSGQGTTAITYTPSGTSVTLTVTQVKTNGCGITTSKTVTTACAVLGPPTNVVATATSPTTVSVDWTVAIGATSYRIYRSSGGAYAQVPGTPAAPPFTDTTAAANTAYVYKVHSHDGSVESVDSNVDLATTVIFTDTTLTPTSTPVKAVHFTEMRTAVNAVQTLASQANTPYTDVTLDSTINVKAVHSTELRTRLNAARAAITGLSAATFTNTITGGTTVITALDVNELRAGVQ